MSSKSRMPSPVSDGWEGWDQYAPFYDWENAQTLGRRDVAFWRRFALEADGAVLELGCGTGRISLPLARAGVKLVGIDRSAAMLARARRKFTQSRTHQPAQSPRLIRADIRALPFASREFDTVLAPYGILQSLLRDEDLMATLQSVARVLVPRGRFGIDLVPDVPSWAEYRNRVQLRGRAGEAHLTLIESVRQDRARRVTIFEQCYVARQGKRAAEHRFELAFRTLSVPQMTRKLEASGFAIDDVVGDYRGGPWDAGADAWIILARRT